MKKRNLDKLKQDLLKKISSCEFQLVNLEDDIRLYRTVYQIMFPEENYYGNDDFRK